MLGVDYTTFMELTPGILNNTYKRRLDYDNHMLHLAGFYTHSAFSSVLGTAFGKKRVDYIDEPIILGEPDEETEERMAKKEHQRNMANWMQMVEMSNQKFKR